MPSSQGYEPSQPNSFDAAFINDSSQPDLDGGGFGGGSGGGGGYMEDEDDGGSQVAIR
jgi:hypothetical protein